MTPTRATAMTGGRDRPPESSRRKHSHNSKGVSRPKTATLTDDRAAALKAAQDIIDAAKSDERDLTDDEIEQVEAKQGEVRDIDRKIRGQGVVKSVLALSSADDAP